MKRLRLAYYGDDFTGSTDVMEALSLAGVRTVLFLEPPRPAALARFPGVEAVGVAGVSRALPTGAIERELRPVFEAFRALNPQIVHYKTCSTFDSSPTVGSIGRALDVGAAVFPGPFLPVVVGAPALGRYVVFGNLFARSGPESEVFRLDRHPTMRRHPVTPMTESDLRLHLARQTDEPVGLFDVQALALPERPASERLDALTASGTRAVLFDTLTPDHLTRLGHLIAARAAENAPLFAVGSSGLEYALTAHWRTAGELPDGSTAPATAAPGRVEQIAIVSGSCSPVTARQIDWAEANGFGVVALDTERLIAPETDAAARAAALSAAREHGEAGRSVIVHAGRGPDDPRIAATLRRLERLGETEERGRRRIGQALGEILRLALERTGIRRAVVAGGDTSSVVARQLGIEALEFIAPIAPGSPLCRVHSRHAVVDGIEMLFKGGQVGTIQLLGSVRDGVSEKPV